MSTVTFTPKTRDQLRKAYDAAVEDGLIKFEFDGNDYLVAYAKYLLEFLDGKFA